LHPHRSHARRFQLSLPKPPPQFWRTLAALDANAVLARRAYRDTNVVARLRDGFKLSEAAANVSSIQRRLALSFPDDRNFAAVAVTPLLSNLTANQARPLF
jgi:hypothetical protein